MASGGADNESSLQQLQQQYGQTMPLERDTSTNEDNNNEETTLSYILRYEQMIRQQDIEGTTTLLHILQLFRSIQRLGGIRSEASSTDDDAYVSFEDMKKTLELLKEEDEGSNEEEELSPENETTAAIMTMMMSTDTQLMTMLSTLVQAYDDFYQQHSQYLPSPSTQSKRDALSLAEFYHCYQIVMNAVQSLQVAAEPKISKSFSFSTSNQEYPELDKIKEGDELTSKIVHRTRHLIEAFFDPPNVVKIPPLKEVETNEEAKPLPQAPPPVEVKTTIPNSSESEEEEMKPTNNRSRDLIFLGAMSLHVAICAAGYWWSVNVYDNVAAPSSKNLQVKKLQKPVNNETMCIAPTQQPFDIQSHRAEEEEKEETLLKQERLQQQLEEMEETYKQEITQSVEQKWQEKLSSLQKDHLQEQKQQLQELEEEKQTWKQHVKESLEQEWQTKVSSVQDQLLQEQQHYEEIQREQELKHFWEVTTLRHEMMQSELQSSERQQNLTQTYETQQEETHSQQAQAQQEYQEQITSLEQQLLPLQERITQAQHELEAHQNKSVEEKLKLTEEINNIKVQLWMQRYINEHALQKTKEQYEEEMQQERLSNVQELTKQKRTLEDEFTHSKNDFETKLLVQLKQQEERFKDEIEIRMNSEVSKLESDLMKVQAEKESIDMEYQKVQFKEEERRLNDFLQIMTCSLNQDEIIEIGEDECGRYAASHSRVSTRTPTADKKTAQARQSRKAIWKDRLISAIGGALIVLVVPQIYTALGFGAGAVVVKEVATKSFTSTVLPKAVGNTVKSVAWMNLGSWNPRWKDMGSSAVGLWRAFMGV